MFLLSLLLLGACGGIAARVEDVTVSDDYQPLKKNENCVPNTVEMCRDLPYNETILPNLLRHTKIEEAEAELNQFKTLVSVKCSPDIKLFLCTMYAPVCTIMATPLPPCRHLCQSAKEGCESLMVKFGYSWPEIFNCDKFPENGMCVGENRTTPAPEPRRPTHQSAEHGHNGVDFSDELECPHTMKVLSRTRYSLLIANTTIEQCSLPCQNDGVVPTFFNAHTRNYLRLWTGVWAVACCVGTLFTIVSFIIDLQRFEFPERAIFYMSLCYLAVSGVYIAGMAVEDNLSCSGMSATKQHLVTQGVDNFACTAMAVAHYYFTTAGIIWWVILSFAWFLVTTLKWGEQPVGEMFSSYFNIFAWGVPCIMTLAVLITHNVDGDLLTGVCSVGNLRPSALFNFVVVPQSILIAIGLVLFICGFISIMRIRSYIKGQPHSKFEVQEAATEKVGRLMLRISLFAAIYIVPTVAANMENWLTNWYSTRCLHAQRGTFGFTQAREMCPIDANAVVNGKPEPVIFFLRYASFFTVGIACGIWTANGKTFNSFRELYIRVFHGRSRVPTRVH